MGWRSFYYNPPVIICQIFLVMLHDNCMSKQFVNDVVSIAIAGTKCPCLPWKGNVINLRALFQHAQKLVIEFIDNASAR